MEVGGGEAVDNEIASTVESSLGRAELIAVPLTLIVLVFVFRSVIAASLPLLVGVMSITGTLFALFVLGSLTDVSIYSINLTTALGLGLGDRLLAVHRVPVPGGAAPRARRARRRRAIGGDGGADRRCQRRYRRRVVVGAADLPALLPRSFAYAGIAVVAPGDARPRSSPCPRCSPCSAAGSTRRARRRRVAGRGPAASGTVSPRPRHAAPAADRAGGDGAAAPARLAVPAPLGRPARRAGPAGVRPRPGRCPSGSMPASHRRQRRGVPDRLERTDDPADARAVTRPCVVDRRGRPGRRPPAASIRTATWWPRLAEPTRHGHRRSGPGSRSCRASSSSLDAEPAPR